MKHIRKCTSLNISNITAPFTNIGPVYIGLACTQKNTLFHIRELSREHSLQYGLGEYSLRSREYQCKRVHSLENLKRTSRDLKGMVSFCARELFKRDTREL